MFYHITHLTRMYDEYSIFDNTFKDENYYFYVIENSFILV